MSDFFESIWHGEGVGDGGDFEEALQAYIVVKPDDGDWVEACAAEGLAELSAPAAALALERACSLSCATERLRAAAAQRLRGAADLDDRGAAQVEVDRILFEV